MQVTAVIGDCNSCSDYVCLRISLTSLSSPVTYFDWRVKSLRCSS